MSRRIVVALSLLSVSCSESPAEEPSNSGGAGGAGAGTAGTAGATAGTTNAGGSAGVAAGSGGGAGSAAGMTNAGGSVATGGSAGSANPGGAGATGGSGDAAGSAGADQGGGAGTAGEGAAGSTTTGGSAGAGGAGGSAGTAGSDSAGAAGSAGGFGVCNGAAPASAVSIYVVGDSTASVYASDLYPRMGWGQPLQDLFAAQCAVVKDVARSGRSSKSFIDEGAWTPVRDGLSSGDVVLIQFGHNDEKSDDPTRYTEPQTTYKQYLTTYITDARAKQATPILLTPINRNSWSGTTLSNTHGAYPDAMRELAVALDVSLIDMTALTKAYFERIGQAATSELFLILAAGESANYPDGVTDNTHLQEAGARKLGELVAYDAYRQQLTLGSYLKAVPAAP